MPERTAIHEPLADALPTSVPPLALRHAAARCRLELAERWSLAQANDQASVTAGQQRRVHYLSMEYLIGRALGNALQALGLRAEVEAELAGQGLELGDALEQEPDAALGNGGLGRLAACFLDAMAELELPAFGHGLRYRFGMFAQQICDGMQVESPDHWLRDGSFWEHERPGLRYPVGFGGSVQEDADGVRRWIPAWRVQAQASDFIVPAHAHRHVVTLRLWRAEAEDAIQLGALASGDLAGAATPQLDAESLNWVLYPDDSRECGRELRLKQEALLVSASVQDALARHLADGLPLEHFGRSAALHLNDTHPALAPVELLRLLIDGHGLSWEPAWSITRQATAYTNHTLMPEALETWPVAMLARWLPRHLELIFAINQAFLDEVRRRFRGDERLVQRVSLIDEQHGRRVRMAHLAIVCAHKVNGVAALHSRLMVETLFADFARIFPQRFHNITNGVTPRRWLQQCNPALSSCLDASLGSGWRRDLGQLRRLGSGGDLAELGRILHTTKARNKQALAAFLYQRHHIEIHPDSLFDVQVKRIHEYKRQLLNVLHVVARYLAMRDADLDADGQRWLPRTVLIAGKAASGYQVAKQIIRLVNDVSATLAADPRTRERLRLVFLPNYGVSLAERIMPAADLSQQISTAGTEASGTGNMKLALNGALTLGTWDGATIEMAEAIGRDHLFVFGLRADQVSSLRQRGYRPRDHLDSSPALARALEAIAGGVFNPQEPARYAGLVDNLIRQDSYMLLADFDDYLRAQREVDRCYRNPAAWQAKVIANLAGMGGFAAERAVREYVDRVWSPAAVGAFQLPGGAQVA